MPDTGTGGGTENPFYFGMAGLVNPNIGMSTVPEVTYGSANGTISNFHGVSSNAFTVNIWQSAMAYTLIGIPNPKQAASLAAMGDSSRQFTNDMALSFIAILNCRQGSSYPLYALFGANMLVVIVGITLTIIAIVTSKCEVEEVQSRLSINGLVADRFEAKAARLAARNPDQLFRESKEQNTSRIGIDSAAEGSVGYKTWNEAR
ncbi:hypothetical protein KCU71_g7409, partial [Aureobasidium melanogenum]